MIMEKTERDLIVQNRMTMRKRSILHLFLALGSLRSLGGGELGDRLGALRHGVLGEFSGEEQADGSLDLPRGDGVLLVVASKTAGLGGDALKDVVDEGVHDVHGGSGDSSVGVNLLQDLVDVGGVRGIRALLSASALSGLVSLGLLQESLAFGGSVGHGASALGLGLSGGLGGGGGSGSLLGSRRHD